MRRAIFLLLFSGCLVAETQDTEVEKLSEALGHLIGKNIEELKLPLDLKAFAKGLQDEMAGKTSPLNEEECLQEIIALQEKKSAESANKNLFEAETFLRKNQQRQEIHSLEEGLIQYEITREGTGEELESYNFPLIRLSAHPLDAPDTPPQEELVTLDEILPGLRLGLLGMKEGETRTLYVHPDYAYGKKGEPPNALFIFHVELIRTNGSAGAKTTVTREHQILDLPDPSVR
jgi:peptidylprolyl isomerase